MPSLFYHITLSLSAFRISSQYTCGVCASTARALAASKSASFSEREWKSRRVVAGSGSDSGDGAGGGGTPDRESDRRTGSHSRTCVV